MKFADKNYKKSKITLFGAIIHGWIKWSKMLKVLPCGRVEFEKQSTCSLLGLMKISDKTRKMTVPLKYPENRIVSSTQRDQSEFMSRGVIPKTDK